MNRLILYSPHRHEWEPINLTRPVFDIKCGLFSFKERLENLLGNRDLDFLLVPDFLEELAKFRFSGHDINPKSLVKGDIVFWGDVLYTAELIEEIMSLKEGTLVTSAGRRVALIAHDEINTKDLDTLNLQRHEVQSVIPEGIWDIPLLNGDMISKDFDIIDDLPAFGFAPIIGSGISTSRMELKDPASIYISKGTDIEPFVFLDASEGPIILGEDVSVKSCSIIRGPFFADRAAVIYSARISGGCTIGQVSRVGGEIEASIVHGYSNKYHDGFLGHSYIGEWVNLGALTTNSDLKNNYGNIKYPISKDKVIQTGRMKVGTFIGDHSKIGIGALLNSGSNIGVSTNLYGGGLAPNFISSFKWGSAADGFTQYQWDKARDTMLKVSSRRGITISKQELDLLKKIEMNSQN